MTVNEAAAERYSVPDGLAGEDVSAIRSVPEIPAPSILGCIGLILAVKTALRAFGFARTFRAIRAMTDGPLARQGGTHDEWVIATADRVAIAGALFPGRALCLEQSLVLYYMLRGQGVPVVLRIGVQAHPFQAHAWIEHQGDPINEDRERLRYFTLMPEIRS